MRRLLAVAVLAISAWSCSKAPMTSPLVPSINTTPAAVYADFSGISVVNYKLETCDGWRHCVDIKGRTRSIELRLRQTGRDVTGLLIESSTKAMNVTGTVSGDGELTLQGSRGRVATFPQDTLDSTREISTFKLRKAADASVSGSVLLTGFSFEYVWKQIAEGGAITSYAPVQPLTIRPGFAGTWSGTYLVRSCSVSGAPYCRPRDPGELDFFTMTLMQDSAGLHGTIATVGPVDGSGSGSALSLAGRGAPYSSTSTISTISDWNTYRDEFGQLHGTFKWTYETGASRTISEIELYFVTQQVPVAQALVNR